MFTVAGKPGQLATAEFTQWNGAVLLGLFLTFSVVARPSSWLQLNLHTVRWRSASEFVMFSVAGKLAPTDYTKWDGAVLVNLFVTFSVAGKP